MRLSFSPILFFMIFAAVVTVLSAWVGGLFWNSALIAAGSLALSALLFRSFKKDFDIELPVYSLLPALIVMLLTLSPVLYFTSGYMGSTDAMHFVHVRIITDHVPSTYEPYSPLHVYYFMGYTFVAKLFSDLAFFLPDHVVVIAIAAIFAAIQAILIFAIGKEIWKSETAGFFAALLFVGTKFIYQNMFYGLFPEILGTALFLLLALAVIKKSPLKFIFFPAMMLTQFTPLMYFLLTGFIAFLVFRPKISRQEILLWVVTALLAAPVFPTYVAFAIDGLHINGGSALVTAIGNPFSAGRLSEMVLFLGLGPALVFMASSAIWLARPRVTREVTLLLIVFFSSNLAFLLLAASSPLFYKIQELSGITGILFSSFIVTNQDFPGKDRYMGLLAAALIVLMVFGFFSSGTIMNLAKGTKIRPNEAKFALEFRAKLPERAKTLFVLRASAMMAVLSDKIPIGVLDGYFVSHVGQSFDPYYPEELQKQEMHDRIVSEKCASCISGVDVNYVVVPDNFFPESLPYPVAFEYGGFTVYRKT